MNNRKNKKRFKKKINNKFVDIIKLGVCVQDCDYCRKDSIAHEIKHHFERDYIQNSLFMKYENGKLLISKKQFNHLIRLCNSIETVNDYDLEFVDEIEIGR